MCEGLSSGNDELLQLNECHQLCWSITQQIEREKTKSSENIEDNALIKRKVIYIANKVVHSSNITNKRQIQGFQRGGDGGKQLVFRRHNLPIHHFVADR